MKNYLIFHIFSVKNLNKSYTEDEKERNFKALRGEFNRSLEDRNPSYMKAVRAAQERMKNKNKK